VNEPSIHGVRTQLRELTSSFTESMKNYKSSIHHRDPYNRMPLGRPDATTITLCSMSWFETGSSFSFPSSLPSSSLLSSTFYSASSPVTPSSSGTISSSVSRSVKSLLSLVLTRDMARWLPMVVDSGIRPVACRLHRPRLPAPASSAPICLACRHLPRLPHAEEEGSALVLGFGLQLWQSAWSFPSLSFVYKSTVFPLLGSTDN
jgi:hypothetical protein